MQRPMAVIVIYRMKNPLKKLEFSQFLLRFQALLLLCLRNIYLSKNLKKIFTNIVRFIKVTVIRDADKVNQDKIAVHLFCIYS